MTRLFPSKNYYAVPVPVDAKKCRIVNGTYVKWLMVDGAKHCVIDIPGKVKALFLSKNCSEQEAARVVEQSDKNFGYKDYEGKQASHFYADKSLASLLRSLGLMEENYLIIEKIE